MGASYFEIVFALLVAGVGISMALPAVTTAVMSSVARSDLGKASGVNAMIGRFGAVFAVAIGSTVFAASGSFGSPSSITDGRARPIFSRLRQPGDLERVV